MALNSVVELSGWNSVPAMRTVPDALGSTRVLSSTWAPVTEPVARSPPVRLWSATLSPVTAPDLIFFAVTAFFLSCLLPTLFLGS